jgi:hypothetical protein
MTRYIQFIIIFILFTYTSNGQNDTIIYDDIVKLSNGHIFKCKIIDFNDAGYTLEKTDGKQLFFPHDRVTVVSQAQKIKSPSEKRNYFDQSRRLFGVVSMSSFPDDDNNGILSNWGVNGGIKYKMTDTLGSHFIGLNIGVRKYQIAFDPRLYDLSVAYDFVLNKSKISPYLNVNAGLGFNPIFSKENNSIKDYSSNGGFQRGIGLGILSRSKNDYALNFGISYIVQDLDYTINTTWNSNDRYSFTLRRYYLTLGVLF